MSVQKVAVDDTDASIVYSGQWSVQRSSDAYDNSLHVSTSAGASASLSFTGISVNIVGAIPPCTVTGAPVTYQVILDGSPVDWGTQSCTTSTEYITTLYSASSLSNGPHKVTIIDEANGSPSLMLDLFAYVTDSEGTTTSVAVATSGTSSTTAPVSDAASSISTISSSGGSSSTTSTPLSSSSTGASVSTTGASSSSKVGAGLEATTSGYISSSSSSLLGLATPTSVSSSNGNLSQTGSSSSSSHSIGPIIGGVLAAILVLLLLFLRLLIYYRKRKARILGFQHNNSSEIVMPFNLDDPESFVSASALQGLAEAGSGRVQERNFVAGPLQRSMPNNVVPFILDQTERQEDVTGSARPSSVIDPEENLLSSSSYEKRAGVREETVSSPSSSSIPVSDEKSHSGPRFSAVPSDAVPAYMRDPEVPVLDSDLQVQSPHSHSHSPTTYQHQHHHSHPASIAPSDAVPAYMRDPDNINANSGSGLMRSHYHSGMTSLTDNTTTTGAASQISEVPPAYNDCCALRPGH